jgi:hypothetical protein
MWFFFIGKGIAWALEIQLVMQIILNRLQIILPNDNTVPRLKIIYLAILLLINAAVFTIWINAESGSKLFVHIDEIFDPVEIAIVIVLDVALNMYFIISIKQKLLSFGLAKYKLLIKANILIILANLIADVS